MKTFTAILLKPSRLPTIITLPFDNAHVHIAKTLNAAHIDALTRYVNGIPYLLYLDEASPLVAPIREATAMLVSDKAVEVLTGNLLIAFIDTKGKHRNLTKKQIKALTSTKNMINVDEFIAAKNIKGSFFIDENVILLPGGALFLYDYPNI